MSDRPDRHPDAGIAASSAESTVQVPGQRYAPPIMVSALPDQQPPLVGAKPDTSDSPAAPSPATPSLPATSPATPSPPAPVGADRSIGALLTPVVLTLLAAIAALAGTLADPRVPTSTDWHVTAVLGALGVVGMLVGYRFNPPDNDAAPPWDVHTIWLLPAALLTPPSAFAVLVVLSVVVGMVKGAHPLRWRVVVASITVLTTMAIHAASQLVPGFALSAVVGIAALWVIGAAIALIVAHVIGTPSGTVLWLDDRWTLVELGCAFSGMLIAAAMRTDPNLGFAGLAPLLFAAFALRWPELSRHARIDPKTGLPNAWHWEERTRELLNAAELRSTPVSVMIIDIDRFKLVNDTYGHLVGDQVLGELADTLRGAIREGDLVGRFGGEEFVVTMFGMWPASAVAAAERIRTTVANQQHLLTGTRADEHCSITCTIGVASSTPHGYELTRLLDLADIALAAGKAAGRNQVRDANAELADQDDGDGSRGGALRSRSLLSLPARRHSDRRTLRHGPGSMFR